MRFEGRIAQWNDERGFGFIAPTAGGEQIFVHISAFASADRAADSRPQVGERVSFEVETDPKGRKQARRVSRPDVILVRTAVRPPKVSERRGHGWSHDRRKPLPSGGLGRWLGSLMGWILVGVIGWQAYQWWAAYSQRTAKAQVNISTSAAGGGNIAKPDQGLLAASPAFRCDGRRYCSQMTSCSEATYFLRNCPGVQMDGNGDGVPCEQQWCTSPFAK